MVLILILIWILLVSNGAYQMNKSNRRANETEEKENRDAR